MSQLFSTAALAQLFTLTDHTFSIQQQKDDPGEVLETKASPDPGIEPASLKVSRIGRWEHRSHLLKEEKMGNRTEASTLKLT